MSLILALLLVFGSFAWSQADVLSGNYGDARTNAVTTETILTHAAVSGGKFGKLGGFPIDGQIFAQPLYVSGLAIPGRGIRNVVFAATMNNTVYAFDADAPSASAPLWRVSLGPAAPAAQLPDVSDISSRIGILSTPAIDADAKVLYVVAETFEAGTAVFRLHGLSLLNGQEMQNGPVAITASVTGNSSDAVNGVLSFDPAWHLQRPGLALANGNLYVGFGSHGDAGNYHGWLMAYDAANLQRQTAVFNVTPDGWGGGIWQSGRAPAVDDEGNILIVTGNGDFNGSSNLSGAVVKLSGADLSVLDWYTPAAWAYLNAHDLDVGSTGPVLVTGTNLTLAGDKGGRLINLNSSSLGHIEAGRGTEGFAASRSGIFNLALWQSPTGTLLYQHDFNGFLKAYPVTSAGIDHSPVSTGTWNGDSLYQGLVITANGSSDGIVWETTGNRSLPGMPATLHAWNASDLTQELWNSDLRPGDVLGAFSKFTNPLIANGRVYVPTLSGELVVYGVPAPTASGARTPHIASVLNAASLTGGPVSPGEILTIMGTNLGPDTPENAHLEPPERAPSILGGTQVFFGDIAAPLLSTAANQIVLIVPFEVVSPDVHIVVRNAAGLSASIAIDVAEATPAVFSRSGLGSGEAQVLNADGSTNSTANPAALNSVISILATGLGQTTPAGVDGSLPGAQPAAPNLPVSVLIGGSPASLVYAGAVPGQVEGLFMVKALVPPDSPTGSRVSISVLAGGETSQSNVWIAVAPALPQ